MKSTVKTIIYFLLNLFFLKNYNKDQAIVLMYHSVSDNKMLFSVKPELFKRQMRHLFKNKYNIVSLGKLFEYLKNKTIPPKTIAITFDDGYQDNYLCAFPVLKKYNIPAAIFITASLVGHSATARNGTKLKMLDYNEIKEMQNSGLIEIGSHCLNHKKLANLNKEEIIDELSLSKKALGGELNCEINFLAYPFGSFNEAVKSLARKYYKLAFSVNKGKISHNSDLFELKRNSMDCEVTFYQFKHIIKYGRL